jgi:hypothetical protein
MRAGNRVAVICILLVAVLIAAALAAKYRECRSHGQAEPTACGSPGENPNTNGGRFNCARFSGYAEDVLRCC